MSFGTKDSNLIRIWFQIKLAGHTGEVLFH